MQHTRDALDFADRVARIDDADHLVDAFHHAVQGYGLSTFIMTGLPVPGQRFEPMVMLKHWPDEWYRVYARERFIFDDPIALRCRSTAQPFDWAEARYDPGSQPRAHRIMRDAVVSGFEAAISLGGERPNLSGRAKASLHLMSLYAYNRLRHLQARQPSRTGAVLSPREREVLCWAAAGKTAWEVSCILGVAESTIEKHVSAAIRKLGASNKVHAVAEALRRGEIPL
jgi:LuxR family quorum sensing-dependent transcriptional regulator